MYCSSFSTKRGMSSVPGRKPVRAISAMRPSMMTLVSSRIVRLSAQLAPEDSPPGAEGLEPLKELKRLKMSIDA